MIPGERYRLLVDVHKRIRENGMPINIRDGANDVIADWVTNIVKDLAVEDEPLGVIMGCDYDLCPKCGGVVGSSAYFCKRCGSYLREVPSAKKKID